MQNYRGSGGGDVAGLLLILALVGEVLVVDYIYDNSPEVGETQERPWIYQTQIADRATDEARRGTPTPGPHWTPPTHEEWIIQYLNATPTSTSTPIRTPTRTPSRTPYR